MTIYALFMCFQATGACQMYAPAHLSLGQYFVAQTFASAADCEIYAKRVAAYPKDTDGHFLAPFGWYECRGKHVDTWESAQ